MPGFYDVSAAVGNALLPGSNTAGLGKTLWLTDDEIATWTAKGITLTQNVTVNSAPGTNGITRYRDLDTGDSYATDLPKVILLTGNLTLTPQHNNAVFRNDTANNYSVTVPTNLPECFSALFGRWGSGNITLVAGSGMTNRASLSATTNQYDTLSLLVMKTNGSAGDYIVK